MQFGQTWLKFLGYGTSFIGSVQKNLDPTDVLHQIYLLDANVPACKTAKILLFQIRICLAGNLKNVWRWGKIFSIFILRIEDVLFQFVQYLWN